TSKSSPTSLAYRWSKTCRSRAGWPRRSALVARFPPTFTRLSPKCWPSSSACAPAARASAPNRARARARAETTGRREGGKAGEIWGSSKNILGLFTRPVVVDERTGDLVDAGRRAVAEALFLADVGGAANAEQRLRQNALLHDAVMRGVLLQLREARLELQDLPTADAASAIGVVVHTVDAVDDVFGALGDQQHPLLVRHLEQPSPQLHQA